MNHSFTESAGGILLRPLCKRDIENLRRWRNDEKNNQYLRTLGEVTPKMQEKWFENYIVTPKQLIFAIEMVKSETLIGSLSLNNINSETGTAVFGSVMIGESSARGKGYGKLGTLLCSKIAFLDMQLARLVATVHTQNIPAICAYTHVGYEIKGVKPFSESGNEEEFIIELTRGRFELLHPELVDHAEGKHEDRS